MARDLLTHGGRNLGREPLELGHGVFGGPEDERVHAVLDGEQRKKFAYLLRAGILAI